MMMEKLISGVFTCTAATDVMPNATIVFVISELVEGAQNATEDLREQKRLDEKDENAKQSVLVGHK